MARLVPRLLAMLASLSTLALADPPANETAQPQPLLYDVLFTGFETTPVTVDRVQRAFESGGLLTTDRNLGSTRFVHTNSLCYGLATLLQRFSPRTTGTGSRQLRQRVLRCDASSSKELPGGTGEPVGGFAIVNDGASTLDVFLLVDRVYASGQPPPDLELVLVNDLGGYLFANADYLLGVSPAKVDGKAVAQASRALMSTLAEHVRRERAKPGGGSIEPVLQRGEAYIKRAALGLP